MIRGKTSPQFVSQHSGAHRSGWCNPGTSWRRRGSTCGNASSHPCTIEGSGSPVLGYWRERAPSPLHSPIAHSRLTIWPDRHPGSRSTNPARHHTPVLVRHRTPVTASFHHDIALPSQHRSATTSHSRRSTPSLHNQQRQGIGSTTILPRYQYVATKVPRPEKRVAHRAPAMPGLCVVADGTPGTWARWSGSMHSTLRLRQEALPGGRGEQREGQDRASRWEALEWPEPGATRVWIVIFCQQSHRRSVIK